MKVGKIAKDRLPQVSDNLITDPDIIDKDWVMRERRTALGCCTGTATVWRKTRRGRCSSRERNLQPPA